MNAEVFTTERQLHIVFFCPTKSLQMFFLVLVALVLSVVSAEEYDINVPAMGGDGVCSSRNVTSLSFTVTAASPGLTAVLAANQEAYNALKNANLSDPSSADLPAPLLDMSCTQVSITTCQKTFPSNRKLRSQIMCILLKNDNRVSIAAKIDVTFGYDDSPTTTSEVTSTISTVTTDSKGGVSTVVITTTKPAVGPSDNNRNNDDNQRQTYMVVIASVGGTLCAVLLGMLGIFGWRRYKRSLRRQQVSTPVPASVPSGIPPKVPPGPSATMMHVTPQPIPAVIPTYAIIPQDNYMNNANITYGPVITNIQPLHGNYYVGQEAFIGQEPTNEGTSVTLESSNMSSSQQAVPEFFHSQGAPNLAMQPGRR